MRNKQFTLLLTLLLHVQVSSAAPLCIDLFTTQGQIAKIAQAKSAESHKITIAEKQFDDSTQKLRSTLSGKLATVWRSEWKAKLSVLESNQYVKELVENQLTPASSQEVLKGLDLYQEGFTRDIHERLYELQSKGKSAEGDMLSVRDKPSPEGVKDVTFTYYTKAIQSGNDIGKHQIRIRTYIRNINFSEIKMNDLIEGYSLGGEKLSILKINENEFKVDITKPSNEVISKSLSFAEIKSEFGENLSLLAPHGKSFKLEVKTALNDVILDHKFPNLGGNHMVQKLDASLNYSQVQKLFAPLESKTPGSKRVESYKRISDITMELIAKNPENKDRIKAVFEVMKIGVKNNENYLVIEGATLYHRTAFESKSGYQSTIDRGQGVYSGQMYETNLKNPLQVIRNNDLLETSENDARHVEMKVPVTSISQVAGINFYDPSTAPIPQLSEKDQNIIDAVSIYSKFVKNNAHPGKFNYLKKNGN